MDDGSRLGVSAGRPLVAICTPVYNGAKWLEAAALASMKAQTYRPLVHVIVDNASTDGTAEIIAKYVQEAPFPVIVQRNPKTISQVENFEASVQLAPPEAAWFATLCYDDMLKPNAIAEMMALAEGHPDMVMIGGGESINETLRPSFLPADVSVFDASNMAARIFEDDARPPFPHVLFRRDFLKSGEPFFDGTFVSFDVDAVLRVLTRGAGAFGFVHKHLFNNMHHAGTVTANSRVTVPYLWENMLWIERYGPLALSNSAYKRVHKNHMRTVFRRFAFWAATGRRTLLNRDLARFAAHGVRPRLGDYLDAIASWPGHVLGKRLNAAFAWPKATVRRASEPANERAAKTSEPGLKRAS